jgi:hypothetical protein
MSQLEPEVKDFLKKIMQSVFVGLLWMFANMIMGIFLGWLFINDRIKAVNIIFYIFFATSSVAMGLFYYRVWKKKFPHG